MAWIEFHPARIKKLLKFTDLCDDLGICEAEGVGILGSLWGEALESQEDGDLTKWRPAHLKRLTGTSVDGKKLWKALVDNGWLDQKDGTTLIHDWWTYAGKYLIGKYKRSPRKWMEIRELHSCDSDVTVTSDHTRPDQTLPNLTDKTHGTASDSIGTGYERPWPIPGACYMKRLGMFTWNELRFYHHEAGKARLWRVQFPKAYEDLDLVYSAKSKEKSR